MLATASAVSGLAAGNYENFSVALYVRAYEVQQMKDPAWLAARWAEISRQLKVDKVYLEVYRDEHLPDGDTLEQAKRFFAEHGVKASAGIATVWDERNLFQTFCYTTDAQRRRLQEAVELAAHHFDELIVDDFFFTSCKCESCIKAKGARSWQDFRLELMEGVARDLVTGPARKVNPKIHLILKFPNWYQHFQGCGYNLEKCPPLFDEIYTGTETRDAVLSAQHLQPYESYLAMRFIENVKPGHNQGGWVDIYGSRFADRYAEQLWLTLFAKRPEITLFDWRGALTPVTSQQRGPWQGQGSSFDYDALLAALPKDGDGRPVPPLFSGVAGQAFTGVDRVLGKLGQPVGLVSYNPYHSVGEDFFANFLGMVGVPLELTPVFPTEAKTVFLTESAAADPQIVAKIKNRIAAGGTVIITSGLLRVIQDRGIADIADLKMTGHTALVKDFRAGWRGSMASSAHPILIPQLRYLTNDAWELVGANTETGFGYPLLTSATCGKGTLLVLTVPENVSDLYALPAETLNVIRESLTRDLFVRLEGPAQVSLFVYDNGACVVQSFRDEPVSVKLVLSSGRTQLTDEPAGSPLSGTTRNGTTAFELTVKPHSYRVFTAK